MYKILVADDEALIRNNIIDLLSSFSDRFSDILTAEDGLEAVAKIKEHSPQIVIFDINMPFLNGLEAIEQIRQFDENIIIIIVSGYNKFEYAQQAIENQVFSYLLKPINEIKFNHVILQALDSLPDIESIKLSTKKNDEDDVISYIIDNMGDSNISMNSVAENFHISTSSLSRLIKKETNMTFTNYLTKIRMEKAIDMLTRSNDMNIKEISAKVGFKNQHYFSRAFKNHTGVSPKKYAESIR